MFPYDSHGSMQVGSPENGFDEIRDLFKDDDSNLLQDLDLSFITNKDIASDSLFDDLASYDDRYDFRFNEQGQPELPSLPLNFGDYDLPGPTADDFNSTAQTGGQDDLLPDSNNNQDDQNFLSELNENKNEDIERICGQSLDSDFNVEPQSNHLDHEFVTMLEDNLEMNLVDGINTPPPNAIVEQTFFEAINEANHSYFHCTEENKGPISQMPEVDLHSSAHQVDLESDIRITDNSGEVHDTNEGLVCDDIDEAADKLHISVSHEVSVTAALLPDDQACSASHRFLNISYSGLFLDQRNEQDEWFDQNEDAPYVDHAQQDAMENEQRFEILERDPATQDAIPEEDNGRKRSMSPSPGRQREASCSCNGNCMEKSQARCGDPSCKRSSDMDGCPFQSAESEDICVSQEGSKDMSHSSVSQKRKHEMTENSDSDGEVLCKELPTSSKSQDCNYDLGRCSDKVREVTSKHDTSNSSWKNSNFSQELQQNVQDSSSSKQSNAPARDKYSNRSPKRQRRSVSSPPVRRHNHYSEYRRGRKKKRARSRSPYGRDNHRRRDSSRHRYPSSSYSSRHRCSRSRYSSPALFRRTGLGKHGSCLFVAGFCFSTTERELERKFSRFGKVRDIRIVRDMRSGRSRGYGFISLRRDEEADDAIRALHRTEWNGRTILVEKSMSR